jgi:hypothetical protein
MSAEVRTEYLYYAFCDSCHEGTEILGEDDAEAWAEQHNKEYHS